MNILAKYRLMYLLHISDNKLDHLKNIIFHSFCKILKDCQGYKYELGLLLSNKLVYAVEKF